MTPRERDYLYVNNPEMLRELERGSRSAREWFECNRSSISDSLKYGNGPTRDQIMERERFERENRGAAGW